MLTTIINRKQVIDGLTYYDMRRKLKDGRIAAGQEVFTKDQMRERPYVAWRVRQLRRSLAYLIQQAGQLPLPDLRGL
jgi:hypothetical protein